MCKLAPKTQQSYIRTVSTIAKYLGCSPDTANAEDLRLNQLHLVDSGTSPITLNAAITGQKFLFDVTRGLGDVLARMQSVRVPQCQFQSRATVSLDYQFENRCLLKNSEFKVIMMGR